MDDVLKSNIFSGSTTAVAGVAVQFPLDRISDLIWTAPERPHEIVGQAARTGKVTRVRSARLLVTLSKWKGAKSQRREIKAELPEACPKMV
jgi:hypothetical protein